jgi:formylglycine-generating enzyme
MIVATALLAAALSSLAAASCTSSNDAPSPTADAAPPDASEDTTIPDAPDELVVIEDDSGLGPTCPMFGRGPDMLDLGAICIDSTEVTVGQYAAFLASTPSLGLLPSACSFKTAFSPTPASPAAYPVVSVDWCDAYAFCSWSGKHLCGKVGGGTGVFGDFASAAKDQWQHACSGNGAHVYPYGDVFDGGGLCNDVGYAGDGGGAPIPVKEAAGCVGTTAPSSKLHDMVGNVWEWEDACEIASEAGAGAAADRCRTRGGAFDSTETESRCDFDIFTTRSPTRDFTSADTGFRCCSR